MHGNEVTKNEKKANQKFLISYKNRPIKISKNNTKSFKENTKNNIINIKNHKDKIYNKNANNNNFKIYNNNLLKNNNNEMNNNDNKLSSQVNGENIKYKTINSITNEVEQKLDSNNIINQNQKITIESKDKSYNKSYHNDKPFFSPTKSKNILSFSNPKKSKKKKLKKIRKNNILYNMSRIPPIIDKEGLLMEILKDAKCYNIDMK